MVLIFQPWSSRVGSALSVLPNLEWPFRWTDEVPTSWMIISSWVSLCLVILSSNSRICFSLIVICGCWPPIPLAFSAASSSMAVFFNCMRSSISLAKR